MKVLIAPVVIALMLIPAAASETTSTLGAPTNVAVMEVTETSITLAWGPTQPGEFRVVTGGHNWVTVGWGASEDSRGPVTYRVAKDGDDVAFNLPSPEFTFTELQHQDSFRICVTATSEAGDSPTTCGTISR